MKNKNSIVKYILSFLLPGIIVVLAYINQGIYPGGTNTILIYDMRAQLLALYGYLSNSGPGFDNLFYSMSGGLGGGFYGTLALYISPFDFVYCFVPVRYLPDAIYFMTVLKISLCGLTCCAFLSKNKLFELDGMMTVALSSCYALMTYSFMYAMSPMWLDAVMLLPLLALMLEKIINGKRSSGFVFLMAACIISNYYMGYMCALALIIYFVFRVIENGDSFKAAIRKILIFAIHGIISAGISAFVIIPVALDFGRGKLAEDQSLMKNHVLIKNSVADIVKSFAPQSYATLDYTASPNVFCGSLVLALSIVWLLTGKKNLRARIASVGVVVIYFISFIFGPIDRVWHGFRDPVGFPVRYAFTFVFFMICFATRGYKVYKSFYSEKTKSILGLVASLFVFYTFVELYINGGYILSRLAVEQRYANRAEYDKICDVMDELIPDEGDDPVDYGRISRNFTFSRIDGSLYGYDGFDRFSSSYNYNLDELFKKIGIGAQYHTVTEKGLNPATAALFDIKYFISYYRDMPDWCEFLEEYRLYKLYENKYCLPLAFTVDESVRDVEPFNNNPFYNINCLYNELSKGDVDEVFKKVDYERSEKDSSDFLKKDTVDSVDFEFAVNNDGLYYFYSEDTELVPDYMGTWANGEFSERDLFADSYIDGMDNDTFRNDSFSYITYMWPLSDTGEHVLTLDSSISEVGDTFIYYLDKPAFEKSVNEIKNNGFDLEYIGSKGIKLRGIISEGGYVFVSIPYEKGYHIYVDGVQTDYCDYRNSFILIPAEAGEHEIIIKYFPPGFGVGILISLISIGLMIVFTNNKSIIGHSYKPDSI